MTVKEMIKHLRELEARGCGDYEARIISFAPVRIDTPYEEAFPPIKKALMIDSENNSILF